MTRRAGSAHRRMAHASIGLALLMSGCGDAASTYRSVLRDQAAAYEDLARVISAVTDEGSMKSARVELAKSWGRCEAIRERAQALGPPNFAIREQIEPETRRLGQAFEGWQKQIQRIKALPGGDAFLKGLAMDS